MIVKSGNIKNLFPQNQYKDQFYLSVFFLVQSKEFSRPFSALKIFYYGRLFENWWLNENLMTVCQNEKKKKKRWIKTSQKTNRG